MIKRAARCEIVGLWSRQLAPVAVASELVTSSSRTENNISKAKAKAIACLHEEAPRLTRLERAFWVALKQSYGTNKN